jgi:miniconductance mechanosensitive channel
MPTPTGIPLEIQCFTPISLDEFEGTQAEIVEHLVSVMPEFGLRTFQQPSGAGGARKLPARRSA